MVTQEEVRSIYRYDNGKLYYIKKISRKVNIGAVAGSLNTVRGYWRIRLYGKSYPRHRIVFLYHHGYLPKYVDHMNLDKQDDRIENLREATASQNGANAGIRCNNTSGYKGVSWSKPKDKWRAYIRHNFKRIHLGFFDKAEDAHEAYCKAANRIFGEFAKFD
jgi:hypothetical protein